MSAWDEPAEVAPILPNLFAHLPEDDQPHRSAADILNEVRWAILNHPRSQQTRIGPSEIGHPCPRFMINKLAEIEEPRFVIPWRATVGTAMHSWLQEVMEAAPQQPDQPRYICERKLLCGTVRGTLITGSCDLFDAANGVVWDWKTTNKTHMTEVRRHGVGDKRRIQRHLYGRGWELLGYKVTAVGNIFLMREGELRDTFVDYEPYDPRIALAALDRAARFKALIDVVGVAAALAAHPALCDDEWCGYCRADRAKLPRPTGTEDLLGG